MKGIKKLFFTSLILFIVTMLAACNSNNSGGKKSAAEIEDEPFTLTAMTKLHSQSTPDPQVLDILAEKVNMELDIQFVPYTIYPEKINTAFATESFTHSVILDLDMINQYKEAIRDGQFWEIGPYLNEYEHLNKMNPDIVKNTMIDGKIYMLYQGKPLSRQGVIYRKDWADNLGISEPTNMKEFYEMLKAFTEGDPDGNGKDDTIGLTNRDDLIFGAFKTVASWFHTPTNFGLKDGDVLPEFMFPEYMETLDFFRKIHEEGYINQDFPVASKVDQQALFKSGKAGVYIGSMGDVEPLYKDLKEIHPDAELDVFNRVAGPDGEFTVWALPGYGNGIVFPKSAIKTEDELKRILSFYDYLMSPEGTNLITWGVEGEHYQVKDGKAEIINQEAYEHQVLPLRSIMVGDELREDKLQGLLSYEPAAKAEDLFIDNESFLISDITIGLDSQTFLTKGASLQQIIDDATIKYIIRDIDIDGFNDAIEQWKKQGGNDIIKEYTESYNEGKK